MDQAIPMKPCCLLLLSMLLVAHSGLGAATASLLNKIHLTDTPIDGVRVGHNDRKTIREEMCSTNFSWALSKSFAFTTNVWVGLEPVADWSSDTDLLRINYSGLTEKEMEPVYMRIYFYAQQREQGHTREFLFQALTNSSKEIVATNDCLRILAEHCPLVPLGRLQLVNWESKDLDDVRRDNATYHVVDGELLWVYRVSWTKWKDGESGDAFAERQDAKEADPALRDALDKIEAEARAEMKRTGVEGIGAVHVFWRLKKSKLKQMGIDWRSPAELNPSTIYD